MKVGTIDRIEGDKAVILIKNRHIIMELRLFKENVREGDLIDLNNMKKLPIETQMQKRETKNLLKAVFNKD
jgi:hypothetical protein